MPEGMKEKEMIDLLLKRFIKDYDKTKNPEVRTRYGVFAGIVGIICNLILFFSKDNCRSAYGISFNYGGCSQ